jgi:Zn-dependent protease with chaperone function
MTAITSSTRASFDFNDPFHGTVNLLEQKIYSCVEKFISQIKRFFGFSSTSCEETFEVFLEKSVGLKKDEYSEITRESINKVKKATQEKQALIKKTLIEKFKNIFFPIPAPKDETSDAINLCEHLLNKLEEFKEKTGVEEKIPLIFTTGTHALTAFKEPHKAIVLGSNWMTIATKEEIAFILGHEFSHATHKENDYLKKLCIIRITEIFCLLSLTFVFVVINLIIFLCISITTLAFEVFSIFSIFNFLKNTEKRADLYSAKLLKSSKGGISFMEKSDKKRKETLATAHAYYKTRNFIARTWWNIRWKIRFTKDEHLRSDIHPSYKERIRYLKEFQATLPVEPETQKEEPAISLPRRIINYSKSFFSIGAAA